jgi:hypothetical protein
MGWVVKIRYSLYRRLGGAPGPVWMGAENLAFTGIRSPDRPASNESLYRLSYPGPQKYNKQHVNKNESLSRVNKKKKKLKSTFLPEAEAKGTT